MEDLYNQLWISIHRRNIGEALKISRNLSNAAHLVDSKGRTLLHLAANNNNGGVAEYLIDAGADIDARDSEGKTPLMWAGKFNCHTGTIDILLKSGANISIRDNQGKCAFQHVCYTGRLSIFRKLNDIFSGDVEKIAREFAQWECCVLFSLHLKSVEVTRFLLEHGRPFACSICLLDRKRTVLGLAVRNNDVEHVKFFLNYGVDVNEDIRGCCTALVMCGSIFVDGGQNPEMLRLLLDRGADPTLIVGSDLYPRIMQMYTVLKNCKRDIIRILLDRNVDLYARDASGCCAVHYMAENRQRNVTTELLGRNYDVNARDNSGRTPLHYIEFTHLTNLNFLLDEGANVDAKDNHGITPLMKLWQEKYCHERERRLDNPACVNYYWYNIKRKIECLLCHGADAQAIAPTEANSFFANIKGKYGFYWIQPMLVHLVLIEARGTPIDPVIRDEIYRYKRPREYFEKCTRQLEEMKGVKVWKSISLYELLVAREVKIDIYLRNEKLLSNLRRIKYKNQYIPYYIYVLRDRILRAVRVMRLRDRIAAILYETVGLCQMSHHTIVDKITNYLCERDLRKLYRE